MGSTREDVHISSDYWRGCCEQPIGQDEEPSRRDPVFKARMPYFEGGTYLLHGAESFLRS